jgi:hypothetical protein
LNNRVPEEQQSCSEWYKRKIFTNTQLNNTNFLFEIREQIEKHEKQPKGGQS